MGTNHEHSYSTTYKRFNVLGIRQNRFTDSKESYEDSYAITQEFREWITCPGGHHELLEASVLAVPNLSSKSHSYDKTSDADEALEI